MRSFGAVTSFDASDNVYVSLHAQRGPIMSGYEKLIEIVKNFYSDMKVWFITVWKKGSDGCAMSSMNSEQEII
jgi:hypothetical protein